MTHQKIRRTTGNLERFAVMYDVRINQHIQFERDVFIVTTDANMNKAPYLCIQLVSVVGTYVANTIEDDHTSALYELLGRFNLWVTIQEEQAARESFLREEEAAQ